jgi:hypothetical protein
MQRLHADYCGPWFGKYYALVVEDAFSKYPEVFITTSASSHFTKQALRRLFARYGVPQVLVSDNGTHFTADHLQVWLKTVGCAQVFAPPRHPCSNGQAENFVRTFKQAMTAMHPNNEEELSAYTDNFLMQYRNAVHSTTRKTPAMLFLGRNLRTSMNFDTTEVLFYRGNNTRPTRGVILRSIGNRMYMIMDCSDGTFHRRHMDQVHVSAPRKQDVSPQLSENDLSSDEMAQRDTEMSSPVGENASSSGTIPAIERASSTSHAVPTSPDKNASHAGLQTTASLSPPKDNTSSIQSSQPQHPSSSPVERPTVNEARLPSPIGNQRYRRSTRPPRHLEEYVRF